jgi:hypothetical protein
MPRIRAPDDFPIKPANYLPTRSKIGLTVPPLASRDFITQVSTRRPIVAFKGTVLQGVRTIRAEVANLTVSAAIGGRGYCEGDPRDARGQAGHQRGHA